MTLEGAINLNETNDYIVYTMNSVTTGQYGVVVPKTVNGTLNMLVDLHMKGTFDGVGTGTKTKEQLVDEIVGEYNRLKIKYAEGMLVMPMIDEALFQSTVANGDKQKMFDEVKKIGAITSELYKKLTDQGIDKQKIDQKIIVVEKTQEDEKFVAWLKEQMPNFVDGVLYSELNPVQEVVNPFVGSSIFGPAQEVAPKVEASSVVSAPTSGGGIFDNVASVTPTTPIEPVVSTSVENVTPVIETPVNPVSTAPVELFGTSTAAPVVQNNETVNAPIESNTVTTNASVAPTQQSVVEGPKPIEGAMLEGTMAFTPVSSSSTEAVTTEEDSVPTGKGSKGFVNLAILLVVLVAVTLVSVELGKYLYSVYGA